MDKFWLKTEIILFSTFNCIGETLMVWKKLSLFRLWANATFFEKSSLFLLPDKMYIFG